MLNKMKQMYMEWKELVGLILFVLAMGIAFLLVDIAPSVSMVIVLLAGGIAHACNFEEEE